MAMRDLRRKPEEVYDMAFSLANLFLIFSVIMFTIYLVAPLFGGKLCYCPDSFGTLDWFGIRD